MDSTSIKRIRKIVDEYDAELLATDPRFRRAVTIIHEDGSYLHFDSAFLMTINDWVACFTEHHGIRIYHRDDLILYWESMKMHTPLEELTIEEK